MATKKTRVEPQGGNGAKSARVDLNKILTPEQVALHEAGFDVLISLPLRAALIGESRRTTENRMFQERKGLRPKSVRAIRNGRSVRFLLRDVLAEQERLIRESA